MSLREALRELVGSGTQAPDGSGMTSSPIPVARPESVMQRPPQRGGGIREWFGKDENKAKLAQALGAYATQMGAGAIGQAAMSNADRLYQAVEDSESAAAEADQRAKTIEALKSMGVSMPAFDALDGDSLQSVLMGRVNNRLTPPRRAGGGGRGGSSTKDPALGGLKSVLLATQSAAVDPGGPGGATITPEEMAAIQEKSNAIRAYNSTVGPTKQTKTIKQQELYDGLIAMGYTPERAGQAVEVNLGLAPRAVARGTGDEFNPFADEPAPAPAPAPTGGPTRLKYNPETGEFYE